MIVGPTFVIPPGDVRSCVRGTACSWCRGFLILTRSPASPIPPRHHPGRPPGSRSAPPWARTRPEVVKAVIQGWCAYFRPSVPSRGFAYLSLLHVTAGRRMASAQAPPGPCKDIRLGGKAAVQPREGGHRALSLPGNSHPGQPKDRKHAQVPGRSRGAPGAQRQARRLHRHVSGTMAELAAVRYAQPGQLTAMANTQLRMQHRPTVIEGFLTRAGLDLTPFL